MYTSLQECFDKHSFDELNNIDYDMLDRAFTFYNKLFDHNSDSIYFDIGCNAGSFVKVLKNKGLTNNIHCFEPHPIISKKTKEVYPYITMNDYCLSNYNGMIDIYIPVWSSGLPSVINRPIFQELNQKINKLNVKTKTLDSYCLENNIEQIDFIKIDVEGAEKLVLEGCSNMLKNKKIKCGIFEVGSTLEDAETSSYALCKFLDNFGYKLNSQISQNDILFYL